MKKIILYLIILILILSGINVCSAVEEETVFSESYADVFSGSNIAEKQVNISEKGRFRLYSEAIPDCDIITSVYKNGNILWKQFIPQGETGVIDIKVTAASGDILTFGFESADKSKTPIATASCSVTKYIGVIDYSDSTTTLGHEYTVTDEKYLSSYIRNAEESEMEIYAVIKGKKYPMTEGENTKWTSVGTTDEKVAIDENFVWLSGSGGNPCVDIKIKKDGILKLSGNLPITDEALVKIFKNNSLVWSNRIGGEMLSRYDDLYVDKYFVNNIDATVFVREGDILTFSFAHWLGTSSRRFSIKDIKLSYVTGDYVSKTTRYKLDNSMIFDLYNNTVIENGIERNVNFDIDEFLKSENLNKTMVTERFLIAYPEISSFISYPEISEIKTMQDDGMGLIISREDDFETEIPDFVTSSYKSLENIEGRGKVLKISGSKQQNVAVNFDFTGYGLDSPKSGKAIYEFDFKQSEGRGQAMLVGGDIKLGDAFSNGVQAANAWHSTSKAQNGWSRYRVTVDYDNMVYVIKVNSDVNVEIPFKGTESSKDLTKLRFNVWVGNTETSIPAPVYFFDNFKFTYVSSKTEQECESIDATSLKADFDGLGKLSYEFETLAVGNAKLQTAAGTEILSFKQNELLLGSENLSYYPPEIKHSFKLTFDFDENTVYCYMDGRFIFAKAFSLFENLNDVFNLNFTGDIETYNAKAYYSKKTDILDKTVYVDNNDEESQELGANKYVKAIKLRFNYPVKISSLKDEIKLFEDDNEVSVNVIWDDEKNCTVYPASESVFKANSDFKLKLSDGTEMYVGESSFNTEEETVLIPAALTDINGAPLTVGEFDGNTIVRVKVNENVNKSLPLSVYLAGYKEDRLVSLSVKTVEIKDGNITETMTIDGNLEYDKISAYVWQNVKPVAEVLYVK